MGDMKGVPGWQGYQANCDGEVFRHGQLLVGSINDGYVKVASGRSGRIKRAVLVCLAFHGEPPSDGQRWLVAHEDDDRTNDRPSNLRWATYSQNTFDKIRNSGFGQGMLNGRAKLSEEDVLEIRRLYDSESMTQQELASQFGVCQRSINLVVRRKTWRHV